MWVMKLATIADKIYITHWRDKYNAGYVFFFSYNVPTFLYRMNH